MTIPYKDVGIGLIKDSGSLGTFSFPPPNVSHSIKTIHMISFNIISFDDPWIVASNSEVDSFDGAMSLSPFEIAYQVVESFSNPCSSNIDPMNVVHGESFSISTLATTTLFDPIHTNEQFCELFFCCRSLVGRSSFLRDLHHFKYVFSSIFTTDYVKEPHNPLKHSDSKLNLGNISRTVPIDILVKPKIIENTHMVLHVWTMKSKLIKP